MTSRYSGMTTYIPSRSTGVVYVAYNSGTGALFRQMKPFSGFARSTLAGSGAHPAYCLRTMCPFVLRCA